MMTNKFKKLFESIDEFLINNDISKLIKEGSTTATSPTDDGPPTFYKGFNDTAIFFSKMKEWIDDLYEDCKNCSVCENKNIRLCPRAMCLAENYIVTGNPLKPAPNHCLANKIEYELLDYISKKAIATGVDKLYKNPKK